MPDLHKRLKYKKLYLDACKELERETAKAVKAEEKLRNLSQMLAKAGGDYLLNLPVNDVLDDLYVTKLQYVCIAAFLEENRRMSDRPVSDPLHYYSWRGRRIRVTE